MLAPGWLVGRGKEALYGREVAWGAVKAEPEPIWLRLSFGWSVWNGLLGEGAFRPMWKEIKKRKSLLLTPIQGLFFLKRSLEPDESMTAFCLSWRYSFKHTLSPKLIWDLKAGEKTLILIHKPTGEYKKQIQARKNGKMEISSTLHVGVLLQSLHGSGLSLACIYQYMAHNGKWLTRPGGGCAHLMHNQLLADLNIMF